MLGRKLTALELQEHSNKKRISMLGSLCGHTEAALVTQGLGLYPKGLAGVLFTRVRVLGLLGVFGWLMQQSRHETKLNTGIHNSNTVRPKFHPQALHQTKSL